MIIMAQHFNVHVGLMFDGHKDRIAKTTNFEREMTKKYKLNRNDFRISVVDDCVVCEYVDKKRIYY
jgi:hypothetical protein